MTGTEPLTLALAIPGLSATAAMHASITRYCARKKYYPSVELLSMDVTGRAGGYIELSSILYEALNRADSAREFGRSIMGVGMVTGQMSIGIRNEFLCRKERLCFDVSVVLVTSEQGILQWGARLPDDVHDLFDLVHEHGNNVLGDIIESRGRDDDAKLHAIGGQVLKSLSNLETDLRDRGRCIVH